MQNIETMLCNLFLLSFIGEGGGVANFGLPDSPFLAFLSVTFPVSLAMLYGKLANRNTAATLLCLKIPPGASCLRLFPVSSTFFLALS
jgi:hypothetical protein